MNVKIFTLRFDEKLEDFMTTKLDVFCKQVKVLAMQTHFFENNNLPFWTVAVEYELPTAKKNEKNKETLPETALYKKLRSWRNQRAKELGFPPYIIAKNKQLALIEQLKPKTLHELNQIEGYGAKKINDYGKDILSIIENEQNHEPKQ